MSAVTLIVVYFVSLTVVSCLLHLQKNPKLLSNRVCMKSEDIPPLKSSPPLKIVLLVEPTPFNYVSGYSNRFKEMLKYLQKAGDEVHILCPDDSDNPPKEFLGFPITSVRGFRFPWYKTVNLSYDIKGKTAELLERIKPDILHVTTPGTLIFGAIIHAYRYNVPLVMSYHTHLPVYIKSYIPIPGIVPFSAAVVQGVHKFADLTLVTSPQLREELVEGGMERVDVWQKGIDVDRFSPAFYSGDMRVRLSEGHPEAPLLVYVGRLGIEKKLKTLRKVLDANPTARLAFVGNGPQREELAAYFKGYNVFFSGQLLGDELSQAYASADVFVMPSDSETLGFVVLEAMASGVPVVGVAAGGVRDLVEPGSNGYLAEPNAADDMEEFSRYVTSLIEDPVKRKTMGAAARTWAEGWSWEAATSKLRNIQYRNAIAIHAARRTPLQEEELSYGDIEASLARRYDSYRPDLC